jgi:hypothetical protein
MRDQLGVADGVLDVLMIDYRGDRWRACSRSREGALGGDQQSPSLPDKEPTLRLGSRLS